MEKSCSPLSVPKPTKSLAAKRKSSLPASPSPRGMGIEEKREGSHSARANRGPWFAAVPPTGAPALRYGAGEGSLPPWGFDMEGGARVWGVQGGETVAGEGVWLSVSRSRCRAGTAIQSRLNVLLLAAVLDGLIGAALRPESASRTGPPKRTIIFKCNLESSPKSRTACWRRTRC